MAKYKLVISDLHIGRGHVLQDGSINVLEDFVAERQLEEFLDFYGSGIYFEADVELIMNGDIFNLIQVDYRGYFSPILTEDICAEKLRAVIRGRPRVFQALKKFASLPNHRVTYIIGNHDVDMIWDKCKKIFEESIGYPITFKNFSYEVDGIHYEHGQQHEAVNRLNPKKMFISKGLKQPILNLPWGSHFVINFIIPLKFERPAIDKVRPLHGFVRWIAVNDFFWFVKTAVRAILYFFATRFSRSLYRTTNLVTTFKILKEISVAPSLVKAAEKVLDMNPDIHTVIMGHTHNARYMQFADGREYFNSGTWTEVTSLDLMSLGKGTRYTYVLVDYTKNPLRPHAYLKEWRGRWHEDIELYTA